MEVCVLRGSMLDAVLEHDNFWHINISYSSVVESIIIILMQIYWAFCM